jgi:PAS domain-containing protein
MECEMNLAEQFHASIDTYACLSFMRQEQVDEHSAECYESPALAMDERGMIRRCNKSGERLFGYPSHELIWLHVSILFPQLSGVAHDPCRAI